MADVSIDRLALADRAGWERLVRGCLAFYETSLDEDALDRAWTEFERDEVLHALGARLDGRLVS